MLKISSSTQMNLVSIRSIPNFIDNRKVLLCICLDIGKFKSDSFKQTQRNCFSFIFFSCFLKCILFIEKCLNANNCASNKIRWLIHYISRARNQIVWNDKCCICFAFPSKHRKDEVSFVIVSNGIFLGHNWAKYQQK